MNLLILYGIIGIIVGIIFTIAATDISQLNLEDWETAAVYKNKVILIIYSLLCFSLALALWPVLIFILVWGWITEETETKDGSQDQNSKS